MSDARWIEIEADLAAARLHFARSLELHDAGGFDGDTLEAYRAGMALMHAMQSGYASLEAMLVRILDLVGEDKPTGAEWHADLVARVGRALPDRPAVLSPGLIRAAGEARRFRRVAMRSYGTFDVERATPALQAVRLLLEGLDSEVARFRTALDPD